MTRTEAAVTAVPSVFDAGYVGRDTSGVCTPTTIATTPQTAMATWSDGTERMEISPVHAVFPKTRSGSMRWRMVMTVMTSCGRASSSTDPGVVSWGGSGSLPSGQPERVRTRYDAENYQHRAGGEGAREMPEYIRRAREVEKKIEAMGVVPSPPPKLPKQPTEMVWKCSHCDALNPASVFKCETCGAPR